MIIKALRTREELLERRIGALEVALRRVREALEQAGFMSHAVVHEIDDALGEQVEQEYEHHCDRIIYDFQAPMCLKWWVLANRLPAVDKMVMREAGVPEPACFATEITTGRRVRLVMASRFGDVGITYDLSSDHGYDAGRVLLKQLKDFSENP